MINYIAIVILLVSIIYLFNSFKLIANSKIIMRVAQRSFQIIQDNSLKDEVKEKKLQIKSKKLFKLTIKLIIGISGALLLPFAFLWVCDKIGFINLNLIFKILLSPKFIIVTSIVALFFVLVSLIPKSLKQNYTQSEKLLHRIAFRTYRYFIPFENLENLIYKKEISKIKINKPIFISSLPRAGTTLLLELLAQVPEFSSHRYRDMPFILTPIFWSKFSKYFKQDNITRERSHGDGIRINNDSPESLEEIIWQIFFGKKQIKKDNILVLNNIRNSEFEFLFRNHLRKIIFLRNQDTTKNSRYISKNNLNISRIPIIRSIFHDSLFIIPFRDPINHAYSMLTQHLNFSEIHKRDQFSKEYMKALGHFEFGMNICPINFNEWLNQRNMEDTENISFWIEYWIECYTYLLENTINGQIYFDYDQLCKTPAESLKVLAEHIDCMDSTKLLKAGESIRSANKKEIDESIIPVEIKRRANNIHKKLKFKAIN